MTKNLTKTKIIESTSYIWHWLFLKNQIPRDGIIVEVAPGHEPKIGNALALLGFKGTIFLIDSDQEMAKSIYKTYKKVLPKSVIKVIIKPFQNIEVGVDIPSNINALVASHPFDDTVMSCLISDPLFFSREKQDWVNLPDKIKEIYERITDKNYKQAIKRTVVAWKDFIRKVKPKYFIASQYPSHTLEKKGLIERQNSGFAVLDELKDFYKDSLKRQPNLPTFGRKGDERWWIIAKNPCNDLTQLLEQKPIAIERLGESIFIP